MRRRGKECREVFITLLSEIEWRLAPAGEGELLRAIPDLPWENGSDPWWVPWGVGERRPSDPLDLDLVA